jgi:type IV secretion system protein VirD4
MLRLGILVFILTAGLAAYSTWHAYASTLSRMANSGWASYLRVEPSDTEQLVLRCAVDARCRDPWLSSAGARVVGWWWLLPIAPLLFVFMVSLSSRTRALTRKNPGEGRWATRMDLRAYLHPRKSYVGYIGMLERQVIRLPENLRCAHTFIIGGTGAGKTTRYVQPNLILDARDGVTAVVFDLKYPDPKSGFMECINYFVHFNRRVYPFTPFDPDSARLNLLSTVKTIQDAFDIAEAFRPSGGAAGGDAFFYNNELMLLAGMIYAVAQEPNPSFLRVYELLNSGVANLQKVIKKHKTLQSNLGTLMDLKEAVVASACAGLSGDLQIFLNANLNRATSPGEGTLLDLEQICREPSFLYIGMPQEELQGGKGQSLLRLVKRLLDRAILSVCSENAGRLPIHLSLYLDEFPSFGPLPNIAENLATMRSRRVAYHIAVQNRAQGEAIYGKDGFRGMVNNNFAQMVIFPRSLRLEDAQYFAENLGQITVLEETYAETDRQGSLFGFGAERSQTHGRREAARALLSAEEMRVYPDGYAVVELIGTPPVRAHLPRLDERANPYRSLFQTIRARYPVPDLRKRSAQAAVVERPIVSTLPPQLSPVPHTTRNLPRWTAEPAEQLTGTLSPTPSSRLPTGNPDDGAAKNPSAEQFRRWFAAVVEAGILGSVSLDETKVARVVVQKSALLDPSVEMRTDWIQRGWIVDNGEVWMVEHLGLSRLTKFWAALRARAEAERTPQNPVEVPTPAEIAPSESAKSEVRGTARRIPPRVAAPSDDPVGQV